MPRRRRKSRLRKKDFMVFSGEQTSAILKTKKDLGGSKRSRKFAKVRRMARHMMRAVGSVLALPFIGLFSLMQMISKRIIRKKPKTDQNPAFSRSSQMDKPKKARFHKVDKQSQIALPKTEQKWKQKKEDCVKVEKQEKKVLQPGGKLIIFQKPKSEKIAEKTSVPKAKLNSEIKVPSDVTAAKNESKPIKQTTPKQKKHHTGKRSWKKRLAIACLVCLLCAGVGWGGWYYFEGRYVYLSVDDNGTTTPIRSATKDVEEMLQEAGIVLEPDDYIDTALDAPLVDDMAIHIIRAKTITIDTGDGKQVQTKLAQGTLQQALDKAGVTLGADDEIDTALDTEIVEDMSVVITRAKEIHIMAKAGDTTVMLARGTVKDALDKSGLEYDEQDEISPSLDTEISDGMIIGLVRLDIKQVTHTEKIAYDTIEKNSNRVERGETQVSQKGEEGVRTITEKIVYKDGKEVNRVEVSNEVTKEPVDKIVLIGTGPPMNPAIKGLPETPTSSMVIRKVTVDQITAYTHTGNKTATGKWPKVGMCAVNPNIFSYGTMFYVPGYGYAVAEDTGANDSSLVSIDLFMDTKEDCLRWGRKRNVTVTICRRP